MDSAAASLLQKTADLPGSQMSAVLAPVSSVTTAARAAQRASDSRSIIVMQSFCPERIDDALLRDIVGAHSCRRIVWRRPALESRP